MSTMSLDGGLSMYVDLSKKGELNWDRYNQKPSPEGRKVRFLDENGWDSDLEKARRFFNKGDILTVKEIYVGRSSSEVLFQEIPDKMFNTVMFEDVLPALQEVEIEEINMLDIYDIPLLSILKHVGYNVKINLKEYGYKESVFCGSVKRFMTDTENNYKDKFKNFNIAHINVNDEYLSIKIISNKEGVW